LLSLDASLALAREREKILARALAYMQLEDHYYA
jgi:hypothetical protein